MALGPTSKSSDPRTQRHQAQGIAKETAEISKQPATSNNILESTAIHGAEGLRAIESIKTGLEHYDQRHWKSLLHHVRSLGTEVTDNITPLWNLFQRTSILPLKIGILEALNLGKNLPEEIAGHIEKLINGSEYQSLAVAAARLRYLR